MSQLDNDKGYIVDEVKIIDFSIYGYVTGQKQFTTSRYKGYIDDEQQKLFAEIERIKSNLDNNKRENT